MFADSLWSLIPLQNELYLYERPSYAYAYYNDHRLNLLSGEVTALSVTDLMEHFSTLSAFRSHSPRVVHLFYELGFLLTKQRELISTTELLAIDIHYSLKRKISLSDGNKVFSLKPLRSPLFNDYQRSFKRGYQELLKGNCYQFNLTYGHLFSFSPELEASDFCETLFGQKYSAYAHATNIPSLGLLYLSNSPECLFKTRRQGDLFHLFTMPIKGTLPLGEEDSWREKYNELRDCPKNRAELDMITDLLRNDLSRIERPIAKVITRAAPLLVPGIIHQYSLIQTQLSSEVSIYQILEALFPGGSITGAPKKRVMKILKELELGPREFYCGSTLLLDSLNIAASINIRSATINFNLKTLQYNAGGGITLLSNAKEEFEEMRLKCKSFLEIFSGT